VDDDAHHDAFLRSRPPRARLVALVEHLEPGSTITGVRRLTGGLEASTHRVAFETAGGARSAVVIRRFNRSARWYDPERLPREAALLASLTPTPVPAPECLLVDVEGTWLETPAMVLTCLRGGAAPPHRWVEWSPWLVAAMAEVHRVAPVVEAEPWLHGWREGEPPASLVGDPWLERVWPLVESARRELEASAPVGGLPLVHHDLHPGNTLWSRGRVSGIVDWPLAGAGYPAYDRAYLRLDVSICLGLDAGDGVAAASRSLGLADDHPAWDLVVGLRALPDPDLWVGVYNDLGVPVTIAEGRRRVAEWFERAIAAVG
jgi:aminoglycoside phosphotransferase (APT) family kinase protein